MNLDCILRTFNEHRTNYIVIGGVNFLLHHAPVLTFDIDIWIEDTAENREACEKALAAIQAEWGVSDDDWGPVDKKQPGWLSRQILFCLTSPHGSIDIFRAVKGLESWAVCQRRAYRGETAAKTPYWGLSDEDMLLSQIVLEESDQKPQRIRTLRQALSEKGRDHE